MHSFIYKLSNLIVGVVIKYAMWLIEVAECVDEIQNLTMEFRSNFIAISVVSFYFMAVGNCIP